MIAHVIETEGPILDAVLARRIARAHGWQRAGSRIRERIDTLATQAHRTTEEDVGTFYWPSNAGPDSTIPFCQPAGDTVRNVDEICIEELVTLAREVIASGKTGEEAVVAMAREMGLQRPRAASRGRIERALQMAGGL
jgi:hypothetical protein